MPGRKHAIGKGSFSGTPSTLITLALVSSALLVSSVLLACLSPAAIASDSSTEAISGQISHGVILRTFLYYVPDGLPDAPVPLVFSLHGGGGNPQYTMESTTEYRWNELADEEKFIVVYPAGVEKHWNDCRGDIPDDSVADDVGFIESLIEQFSEEYNIDGDRIYASGHSNGGMMSFRLAIELSDRFAAVVSNTGAMAANSDCSAAENPVSVMYLAGTADPLVPFDGGEVATSLNGGRGTILSAKDTVDFWVDFLGAGDEPEVTYIPDTVPGDDSTVTVYRYSNGAGGTEVLFYEVDGGGHGWPSPTQFGIVQRLIAGNKNQDVVACDEAWEFFRQHPKEDAGATETTTVTEGAETTSGETASRTPWPTVVVTVFAFIFIITITIKIRRL